MKQLYKTTLVIWTEYQPPDGLTCEELGRSADQGDAYCSVWNSELVADPVGDKDWDRTEFFGEMNDETT